jgi:GH35 family endo-1,4-beta-xylanase
MWPTFNHFPKPVRALREDPEALRRRLAHHVTDEASDCRGKVVDWDVINEHVIYREITDILGQDEAARWFRLAREADPGARLYINEYDVVGNCGHRRHHLDAYERIIRFLLEAGAPVDGIGLQGHFLHFLTPPRKVWRTLDRFGKFGLELAVTEMDITVSNGDEQLQADYLRDFVTACFAHPAMSKLLHWGFWEAAHWRPFTALFGRDWTPRPAARIWEELVRKQWWTQASGQTDRDGRWQCPAFYGAYDVAVEMDGRTENRRVEHSAGGDPVTIELPGAAGDAQ